jgi:hypothetical protein
VDASELPPSAVGLFRVTVSDGFLTASDASDCPVAVGVPQPADCRDQPLRVAVDVKPGSDRGCVNPRGHGVIPAAILGSADVSARAIDPESLVLAGLHVRVRRNGTAQCALEDVNCDGRRDLVCHFEKDAQAWEGNDGTLELVGRLKDGRPITGSDEVCVK